MAENESFGLGKNRVEALSDGLFAIAMTILVLSFKIPNLPSDAPNVQVVPALGSLWPALITYAAVFIGIGVYWILHHMVYHIVRSVDGVLLWLTILFFLFISALPFSVQLVDQFPRAPVTPVILGGNLAAVGWLLFAQWRYCLSKPALLVEKFPEWYKEYVGLRVFLAPVAATATTLICFWSVSTSLAVYLLLLPIYFMPMKGKSRGADAGVDRPGATKATRWAVTIGGVALCLVGWFLFRPELLFINHRVEEQPLGSQTASLLSGSFKGLAHETRGNATLYKSGGDYVLRFTDFHTSNGPDVHVYLVAAPDASNDAVINSGRYLNLGKMKGNEGDQNYTLPPGIDLTMYRSVALWCERFHVNFGACALR